MSKVTRHLQSVLQQYHTVAYRITEFNFDIIGLLPSSNRFRPCFTTIGSTIADGRRHFQWLTFVQERVKSRTWKDNIIADAPSRMVELHLQTAIYYAGY
ncbi:hypothetical protein TNCV_2530101 [Trichonephila clavipes]|nr:hypothetical protein TNCV_2530101 [Trichonephila clavipes]